MPNDTSTFNRNVDAVIQVAVLGAIGMASFFSNALIIFIIDTYRNNRSKDNFLLINLGMSDILVVIVGIPIQSINLISKNGPVTVGLFCQLLGAFILLAFLTLFSYNFLLFTNCKTEATRSVIFQRKSEFHYL